MELFNIDFAEFSNNIIKLLVAFFLPMLTAWDREAATRSAGLRTFPLVSIGACSFTILALAIVGDASAQGRIISGIVTGIGFIGGGAILKDKKSVSGLSTAAALWATGAVGISIGLGRMEIAVALSLMIFFTFKFAGPVKEKVGNETDKK